MLNPSVIDLLGGVADGLRAEVVDALEPGPARDQVTAAIAIVRRVARALPGLVPYLMTDIADLQATLAVLGAPSDSATSTRPDPATDGLEVLIAFDLALRDRLAALVESDGGVDGGVDGDGSRRRVLLDALARMTERDAGLRLSPWER